LRAKLKYQELKETWGRKEKICVMCVTVVSIGLGPCEEKEGENFLFYPYI
jgi:hypothetical protein